MDSSLLVKPDKAVAEWFLNHLEGSEFLVDAAFWLQYPELGEWRLVVASPVVDYSGPRYAYQWIQRVLESTKGRSDLQLNDVSVIGNGDQVLQRLRATVRHAGVDGWIQVRAAMISDGAAGDALVYRLLPQSGSGPVVLDHETLFAPNVHEGRLFWLVGGPSEWPADPDNWLWCGYPQGLGTAQRKAQALSNRIDQKRVLDLTELGDKQRGVVDNDGIRYLIKTDRSLIGAGETAWTAAVIRRVPPDINDQQVWEALSILASAARRAEQTRIAKARGAGTLWAHENSK